MKNKVGIKIKKFRKEKGITQEELANRVNKSTITIRKYEAGEIFPSIANIKTIAEDAFEKCYSLEIVKISGDNDNILKVIQDGCVVK